MSSSVSVRSTSGRREPAPATAYPRRPARPCRRRTPRIVEHLPPAARTPRGPLPRGSPRAASPPDHDAARDSGNVRKRRPVAGRRNLAQVEREHRGALEIPRTGHERVQLAKRSRASLAPTRAPRRCDRDAGTAVTRVTLDTPRASLPSSAPRSALTAKKSASPADRAPGAGLRRAAQQDAQRVVLLGRLAPSSSRRDQHGARLEDLRRPAVPRDVVRATSSSDPSSVGA